MQHMHYPRVSTGTDAEMDETEDGHEPDVRTRLREAALNRFGRQGIRQTSTREILRDAGLKNPSAISYHFGSKTELVEDLANELIRGEAPVLQLQVQLASARERPTIEAWIAVAVDSAVALVSTERGCLLARLWSDFSGNLHPTVFEEFLLSGHPIASQWQDAVATTLPHLPPLVGVLRSISMFRSLDFLIARRAGRILNGELLLIEDPAKFRQLMFEISVGMVSPPTTLTDEDVVFKP